MNGEPVFCCSDRQYRAERFLEVCLLLLLYRDAGYGYGLLEQLALFGFNADTLNMSTLYRTLRKLESRSLVTSAWEDGGPGPRRRVYLITENGRQDLDQWIEVLLARKQRIETVITEYQMRKNTE